MLLKTLVEAVELFSFPGSQAYLSSLFTFPMTPRRGLPLTRRVETDVHTPRIPLFAVVLPPPQNLDFL